LSEGRQGTELHEVSCAAAVALDVDALWNVLRMERPRRETNTQWTSLIPMSYLCSYSLQPLTEVMKSSEFRSIGEDEMMGREVKSLIGMIGRGHSAVRMDSIHGIVS
jgi:hypothetical protein